MVPMNPLETKIKQQLEEDGWTVLRRGWPDFLCFRQIRDTGYELKAVEVKPLTNTVFFSANGSEQEGLSAYQKTVLSVLKQFMPTEIHYASKDDWVSTKIRNCRLNLWDAYEDEKRLTKYELFQEFNGLGVS